MSPKPNAVELAMQINNERLNQLPNARLVDLLGQLLEIIKQIDDNPRSGAGMTTAIETALKVNGELSSRVDGRPFEDSLGDLPGNELIDELIGQLEAFEAGAIRDFPFALSIARALRGYIVGECNRMLGSYQGDTPPEVCGKQTLPGDELCPQHRKQDDALDAWEAASRLRQAGRMSDAQ